MSDTIATIDAYLARTAQPRLDELVEFLRIPTIGVLRAHHADVRAGAEWLAGRMRDVGLEHVDVSETAGHPVVYGDWLQAAGAPTVVVYAHYDVQPVDPLEEWVRPPFEPRVEGGRVYARGVADDKGQVLLHLWAAQAWLATAGRLPLNVRYVIEGEEEAGSPNFEAWLLANRERLEADLVVVTDTGFFEGNHPAVTVGLRGNVVPADRRARVPARTSTRAASAASSRTPPTPWCASSPRCTTARAASACRASTTTSASSPRPSTRRWRALPFDEAAFAAGIGVPRLFGEPGYAPRRAARAPGRRWTSAACGPASRARAPRPSSRRTPTPSSRHGSCPNQDSTARVRADPGRHPRRGRARASRSP